ncbi:unnamed protein product [Rhizophagus irregularis]|nr:unnamed protein product [Rhizophagus irregularis]
MLTNVASKLRITFPSGLPSATSGIFFRLKSTWKSTSNTVEICGNLNSSGIFRIPCDETREDKAMTPFDDDENFHISIGELVHFHHIGSETTQELA